MALMKCPECGKEISDKAASCPACGYPIQEYISTKEREERERIKTEELLDWDETDNIYLDCKKGKYIKIENGIMSVNVFGNPKTEDLVQNFKLQYFAVSMGFSIGLSILNKERNFYTGVFDITAGKETVKEFNRFKDIMDKNNLFLARSRFDELYRMTEDEKRLRNEKIEEYRKNIRPANVNNTPTDNYRKGGIFTKVKCPRCGSIEFQVIGTNKKFSVGKAVVGNTVGGLLGPAGAIAGTFQGVNGKDGKTEFVCSHCGKVWKQKV